MNSLKNRGIEDILITCVDGLKLVYATSTEETALNESKRQILRLPLNLTPLL